MLGTVMAGAQQASLAVVHARVWTGNAAHPWAEALAAHGDRILAVGDAASIQKLIAPRTRVLDARGGMVTPGFIDSHVHFLDGGLSLGSVQLRDARGKAEFVARIKAFAAQHGLTASFMPKPVFGINGSGMHCHQSMFDKKGTNLFFDPKDEVHLSTTAYAFFAGQLAHARALAAVVAPTVNSYKRLVPGYEAPVAGSWGRHSRGALVRVPTPIRTNGATDEVFGTRLELRLPDPSCNPYLAYTVMLAAGLDGLDRGLELGPPLEEIEHGFGASGHSVTKPLPASLGEALAALEDDDVIMDALGSELMELFRSAKTLEWESYRRQVTPWERDTYFQRS